MCYYTVRLLAKHNVRVRGGQAGNHSKQGIVERFIRRMAEPLLGVQYGEELLLAVRKSSERSVEWVRELTEVVAAINDEPTGLFGKHETKAAEANMVSRVTQKPSLPARRDVGLNEHIFGHNVLDR